MGKLLRWSVEQAGRVDWTRTAAVAAFAAPALMWSEFLTMGSLRHGYNLLTSAASDLGTRGTPHADLFTIGFFFLPGALTLLVAVGLWTAHPMSRVWRIGSVLIAAGGSFLMLTGVFPQDPASRLSGELHGLVSQTCFVLITASVVALGIGAHRHPELRAPRRLWLAIAASAVLIEAFNVLIRAQLELPNGVFQRPFTLTLTAWFLATGVWLLRRPRHLRDTELAT